MALFSSIALNNTDGALKEVDSFILKWTAFNIVIALIITELNTSILWALTCAFLSFIELLLLNIIRLDSLGLSLSNYTYAVLTAFIFSIDALMAVIARFSWSLLRLKEFNRTRDLASSLINSLNESL
jgi:hypothetical protein